MGLQTRSNSKIRSKRQQHPRHWYSIPAIAPASLGTSFPLGHVMVFDLIGPPNSNEHPAPATSQLFPQHPLGSNLQYRPCCGIRSDKIGQPNINEQPTLVTLHPLHQHTWSLMTPPRLCSVCQHQIWSDHPTQNNKAQIKFK